ncbi:MAG: G8 domain-containing protein, partial [Acidobacteriota bacterium]
MSRVQSIVRRKRNKHMKADNETHESEHTVKTYGSLKKSLHRLARNRHLTMGIFILFFAAAGTSLIMLSRAATTLASVKSGNWSDPTVWGGRVPGASDLATITGGHTVTFDASTAKVAGVKVNSGGTLAFRTNSSSTLESTENVVIEGKLAMRPANPSVIQTLRFVGVNEKAMVGGGMNVLATDKGLWVMGAGQLDITGSPKTSWTRASAAISQGTASVTLTSAPSGWAVGDEISITPTESPAVGTASYTGFDEASITSVNGATIGLSKATTRPHPKVNNAWTAEVMNLTRNVRLEGTASGRAHIFIRSTKPQTVNHAAIRWMGANKAYNGSEPQTEVLGRYGLHFHHNLNGSRGSIVDGTVVRDTGGKAFVPHQSHGITLKNTISYNTWRPAYWWDSQEVTNDLLVDGAMAAKTQFTDDHKYRMTGFLHDAGNGNTIRNSVSAGLRVCGCDKDGSGYLWPEISGSNVDKGVWSWDNNMTHNSNGNGLFVWQNTYVHVVQDYVGYNNGRYGIRHGAYENAYKYVGGALYANVEGAVEVKANGPFSFENMVWDGGGLSTHLMRTTNGSGESDQPQTIRNVTMRGFTTKAAIWMDRAPTTGSG